LIHCGYCSIKRDYALMSLSWRLPLQYLGLDFDEADVKMRCKHAQLAQTRVVPSSIHAQLLDVSGIIAQRGLDCVYAEDQLRFGHALMVWREPFVL
jgi:hypothetical protein